MLGFTVRFDRPEERFAYMDRNGAHVMLDQIGATRSFGTAPLEHPYGRGMNLHIEVEDVGALYERVQTAGAAVVLALEECWYRTGPVWAGNHQFVVADPNGYLLRFFGDVGDRADPPA